MSGILILSVLLRVAAMGWSVLLVRRLRDRRMALLTLMLLLMAARQGATLASTMLRGGAGGISFTGHADLVELPGLLVSVLALLVVLFLERMLAHRHRSEAALRDSEERIRAIAEHLPGVVYSYDVRPGGRRVLNYLGPGLEELLGPAEARAVAADFSHLFELIHPADVEVLERAAAAGAASGETVDVECRLRRDDGAYTWIRSVSRPIGLDGGGTRWHIVLVDVSGRRRAERALGASEGRLRLLLRELDHRVRNNLASLISLVDLGRRGTADVEAFAGSIRGRIEAMARVHAMLSKVQWTSIAAGETITALQPPGSPGRFVIDGGDLRIPSRQATAFAMVVHELIANSSTHGALGREGGIVRVAWRTIEQSGSSRRVEWTWVEGGGPAIEAVPVPGTGTSLIEGLTRSELGGSPQLIYRREGARYRFEIVLDAPGHGQGGSAAAAVATQRV